MAKYTLPPEHHFYLGRTCKICNEEKPQEGFQIQADKKARLGLTLATTCKLCHQKDRWKIELKYRYGLSYQDYTKLQQRQQGKCAICLSETSNNARVHERLFVDHCHTTGKVRGLLCSKCNHGLGQFNDDEKLLKGAIEYLREHSP